MYHKQTVNRKKNKNERGYTLIEVLITMAVLSIGILGVSAMQISSINGNASARGVTEAANIAAQQVERLKALPFTHPDLSDTSGDVEHQAPDQGRYAVSWTVIDNFGFKDVTVLVEYNIQRKDKRTSITFVR